MHFCKAFLTGVFPNIDPVRFFVQRHRFFTNGQSLTVIALVFEHKRAHIHLFPPKPLLKSSPTGTKPSKPRVFTY
jgi:hypothetical protein